MSKVVTIDGPAGSGKGTVARLLADDLGWRWLDSGALYRVLAYAAQRQGVSVTAESAALTALAASLPVSFSAADGGGAMLEGQLIEAHIRTEAIAEAASKVASMQAVRAALLKQQRDFAHTAHGLVADGRDMGTVVFPRASAKIFLTASVEERTERRYKQLKQKGIDANLALLSRDIAERDARDARRAASPLQPAADALLLDSSSLTVKQVLQKIKNWLAERKVIG